MDLHIINTTIYIRQHSARSDILHDSIQWCHLANVNTVQLRK